MSFWQGEADAIGDLIDEAGANAIVTGRAKGEYTVGGRTYRRGERQAAITSTFRAMLINDDQELMPGDLVQRRACYLALKPNGEVAPEPGDKVTFGAFTGELLNVTTIMPDGATVTHYECEVKL